jgi:hypothetical protein
MACRCEAVSSRISRLVRHQPHGAHDPAALRVDAVVVLAHAPQERVHVELAAGRSRRGELSLEQAIQADLCGRFIA